MNQKNNKRIGLFEYMGALYHYTKDLAIKLAEAGYLVDIFFKNEYDEIIPANTNDFCINENIRFFDFTTKATRHQKIKQRYKKLVNKIAIHFSVPKNDKPEDIIDQKILKKSREIIEKRQYYCLIGIEKQGLIWAGMLSDVYHYPLVYYSLELYIEDYPDLFRFYHILDAERKYHKVAIATIIQDEPRANYLLKSNGIEQANVLYFPVSAKGNTIHEKSKFLKDKLHIDDNKKIVLYFGRIDKTRYLSHVVKIAKDLDDDVILVLHGFGPKRYLEYLQTIADQNKVKFSFDIISEEEIENLISSADIGIALYKTTNANDRLVAFSSGKIAYYTQCGVPMIAFDTESFRELANTFRCVELITNTNEIPQKVRKILENYDSYQQHSYAAYQRFYNLDKNFSKLINQLELIINGLQSVSDKS